MVSIAPLVKALRTYDSDEWEIFISEWQKGLEGYLEVKRLGGGGDLGRDVVGLTDASACEGRWDNYQCKHYDQPLTMPQAAIEVGKIICHSFDGHYSVPQRSYFVAPRGVSTELRDLLLNPSKLRENIVENWQKRIENKVSDKKSFPLVDPLKSWVDEFDFSIFGYKTAEEILDSHRHTAYWTERFLGLLPPPPPGEMPDEVAEREEVYVRCLLDVFGEEAGEDFENPDALSAHPERLRELKAHRERFYDADAFAHHYRDQTAPGTVEDFAEEIFDAIEPALVPIAGSGRTRLTTAMSVAAQTAPGSMLAPRAKVRVKQGVCHQLANDDRVKWRLKP